MNAQRVDRLARALSTTPTRRVLLTALAQGTAVTALATLAAVPGSEDAAAGTCRQLFEVCTSTKQCCRHKRKRRICALNEHSGAPDEPSCCIPEGKRCEFGGQCCDNLSCVGTSGVDARCG